MAMVDKKKISIQDLYRKKNLFLSISEYEEKNFF